MQNRMIARAAELMESGVVDRVLGWRRGSFGWDPTPALFSSVEELQRFVYNDFCSHNPAKYLIKESRAQGRLLAFFKPCDSFSLKQLVKEHRILRENVYAIGVPCERKLSAQAVRGVCAAASDIETVRDGTVRILSPYGEVCVLPETLEEERCSCCKDKRHVGCDEVLGQSEGEVDSQKRFTRTEELERMTTEERFAFWRGELSRCIRCNACLRVCPACSCETCLFDNDASCLANKAAADPAEEQMFHVIRALHVAGRCTDCGECTRACPMDIPLHLINRKLIKDVNTLYGAYQAGADDEERTPLTSYAQDDREPGALWK